MTSLSRQRLCGVHARLREAGFTLIELLVVLAILGMLIGLVAPQVMKYLGRARSDSARIEIENLAAALDLYRLDMRRYPTQQEGLQALVEMPTGTSGWNGPYLKQKQVPPDPWGHAYSYRIPGEHGEYDLYTLGADNAPGGTGENRDVGNW
ncbi:MAG: type II secretion system major pseudopilin GspG [Alphaproteobacteria bacterium]|nr:type II secretion system major pseudopilin GspG [Alphaproteobacteria bacterium]MBV9553900.1 type II secretion system major pseudopilin GspG [Alphaproteobacteria bacterium]